MIEFSSREHDGCHHSTSIREIHAKATRRLLQTDLVILNHDQIARTIPALATPSPNYHTSLDAFEFSTDIAPLHVGSSTVLLFFPPPSNPTGIRIVTFGGMEVATTITDQHSHLQYEDSWLRL
ncbi:hypothetical protein TNCV_1800661 [Trichonephila clavipes]|nr:hypothetical protein TNCV_1800661 [Trichonephila clavipes]